MKKVPEKIFVLSTIELEKPTMEKYGRYEQCGFEDEPSGWMFEGGEEAYYKALTDYEDAQKNRHTIKIDAIQWWNDLNDLAKQNIANIICNRNSELDGEWTKLENLDINEKLIILMYIYVNYDL